MEVTMRRCAVCKGLTESSIRPEHTEDLGGVVVKVLNAVQVFRCGDCEDETIAIPDMDDLARAAAISRALNPVRLAGREVKFFRRVLDMTQAEFAQAMDLGAEAISRWENDARGVGEACERLVRHNVCALLYKEARGRSYDPVIIAKMKFEPIPDVALPPIVMVRVRRQSDTDHPTAWDETAAA
jgi:putative zinc finger/helix-turn-helix YgiT family protein